MTLENIEVLLKEPFLITKVDWAHIISLMKTFDCKDELCDLGNYMKILATKEVEKKTLYLLKILLNQSLYKVNRKS